MLLEYVLCFRKSQRGQIPTVKVVLRSIEANFLYFYGRYKPHFLSYFSSAKLNQANKYARVHKGRRGLFDNKRHYLLLRRPV